MLRILADFQVAQLTVFAAEVTRVSLEVGTEGKLGGQAAVPNVEGTWLTLTSSVNLMVSCEPPTSGERQLTFSGIQPHHPGPVPR
jgi:hypothetical protein